MMSNLLPNLKYLVHHKLKNFKTVEQLKSYIRQEWNNISLLKLQRLVSSVTRHSHSDVKEERMPHSSKNGSVLMWRCNQIQSYCIVFLKLCSFVIEHLILCLCSTVNKMWIYSILDFKLLHSVFINISHNIFQLFLEFG